MIIKLLLISGIASAALFALRGASSTAHLAVRRLAGAGFVAVAALSVLFPDAVTWLAQLVGVAQGSNLVLYALVVAFLFVSIGLHQRLHVFERRLTELTRSLALISPQASESDGAQKQCEPPDVPHSRAAQ